MYENPIILPSYNPGHLPTATYKNPCLHDYFILQSTFNTIDPFIIGLNVLFSCWFVFEAYFVHVGDIEIKCQNKRYKQPKFAVNLIMEFTVKA